MGSAWLFLIAAEAIASTEGLGYRIFLVRRYLAMDVILPYVVWITLLAVLDGPGVAACCARAPFAGRSRSADGHRLGTQCVEGIRRAGRAGESAPGNRRPRVRDDCRRLRLRQDHVPARCCSAWSSRRAARSSSTASPSGPSRIRIAASCSSATRSFPHLTVLENLMLGLELQASRARRPAVRARAARGARRSARHARVRRTGARARPVPGAALRRHAAAHVDRAGRDLQAEDPAARRTLRRARSRHHRRHARAHPASCGRRTA